MGRSSTGWQKKTNKIPKEWEKDKLCTRQRLIFIPLSQASFYPWNHWELCRSLQGVDPLHLEDDRLVERRAVQIFLFLVWQSNKKKNVSDWNEVNWGEHGEGILVKYAIPKFCVCQIKPFNPNQLFNVLENKQNKWRSRLILWSWL